MPSSILPTHRHMSISSAETVGRILSFLLWKFWKLCGAAVLFMILIYGMYGTVIILILLAVTVVGGVYHYQDSLLYFPEQPESSRVFVQTPNSVGLPFEHVTLTAKDKTNILAFFVKQPPALMSTAPTVLYFHGNAGNIGHRLHNVQALYQCCGFNILLVEYRGYGKSDGSPSETGLYQDAQASWDYLLTRHDIDQKRLIIFGRSLGGAVAIHLAASLGQSDNLMALIVENTFTGIPHMAQLMFRGATALPYICYKNKFLSTSEIRKVRVPALFLSGLADQLIPPSMMKELYQGCGSQVKLLQTFPGGTHNGTWTSYSYYDHINKFLAYISRSADASTDSDKQGMQ